MSLSEPIAKRSLDQVFQTFEGHSMDSLMILRDYLLKNKHTLKSFSENFQIDFNTLMNIMYMSVFLHDLGKLTNEFQYRIKEANPVAISLMLFLGYHS